MQRAQLRYASTGCWATEGLVDLVLLSSNYPIQAVGSKQVSSGKGTGTAQAPHSSLHAFSPTAKNSQPGTPRFNVQHSTTDPHTAATQALRSPMNTQQ
jgi:hypothetical protein